MQTDEKSIVSAYMPTTQRDRLAHLADVNGRSLSGECRRAVDIYLRLSDDPGFSGGPPPPLAAEGRSAAMTRAASGGAEPS